MKEDKKLERRLWERPSFRSRESVFMNMNEEEMNQYTQLKNNYLQTQHLTPGRKNHYVANVQANSDSLLQEVEKSHEEFYEIMTTQNEVYRQLRAELNK